MQLPEQFVARTQALLGNEYADFELALASTAPTSIRINSKKNLVPSNEKVAWCDRAYYLPERPLFTADPLLHAGAYYVQEASSMFLTEAVLQYMQIAETVLDLCAAPGGKSTLLRQFLPADCLLVSNEIVRSRAYVLAENLSKWGHENVFVSNNASEDFEALGTFFDAIVVDAPCSGEGMFRKDKTAIEEWSVANVEMCVKRQREILENIWQCLKPGGTLVYSTCTYNRAENEENMAWMCEEMEAEILEIENVNDKIVKSDIGYRFYPHRTKGEGFYMAVLRKNHDTKYKNKQNINLKNIKTQSAPVSDIKLRNFSDYIYLNDSNYLRAYPKQKFEQFMFLQKNLRTIDSGLLMFEQKAKDFIPTQQLALSTNIDETNIVSETLNYEQTIRFLRKESIQLASNEKAFVLLKYDDINIGWVKNLGNRSNNLYPQNWRIRMQL